LNVNRMAKNKDDYERELESRRIYPQPYVEKFVRRLNAYLGGES
jgi:hypothetical protein